MVMQQALLVLVAAFFALQTVPVHAAGRHASMAIDANTGQILHAQGADEARYPASLTKMMTVYIAFELIEQGKLNPQTRLRISPTAAATSPSKLGLEAGAEIALSDALQAVIVKSANDMAVAVAEHIAGSEARFAALMTQKARQLGMAATTFRNAHGLPDSGQVTTARDMLTLAMRLNDDFPRRYVMFSQRAFSYRGVTHRNHNTMLGSYQGMDGLKTGYTTPSGFNLVASVRRNGRHVVAAVFGGTSAASRNAHMRVILDRALQSASPEKTRQPPAIARGPRRERVADAAPAPRLVEPVRQAELPVAMPVVRASPEPVPVSPPSRLQRPAGPIGAATVPTADVPPESAIAPGPVEIARVRPVVVAPRPRPESVAAPAPVAQAPAPSQVIPTAAAPVPPSLATPVMRGAPPSSLQAQADRLKRGAAPTAATPAVVAQAAPSAPAFRLQGPTATRGAEVMIQIGAFASAAEAQKRLAEAQARARDTLGLARPVMQPVTTGGRQLFRARFSGLDAASAAAACNELRRQQIDCQVTPGG